MQKRNVYLAGSIQAMDDGGTTWREKLGAELSELGFTILDPCKSEVNHTLAPTIDEQKKKLANLKRGGAWDVWDPQMLAIQKADLICVLQSDFIIVSYNPKIVIGGTADEIRFALMFNIPIYTVCYAPPMDANDWTWRNLRESMLRDQGQIFQNFKQCVDHIKEMHKDPIKEYTAFVEKEAKQAEAEAKKTAEEVASEEKKEESKDEKS